VTNPAFRPAIKNPRNKKKANKYLHICIYNMPTKKETIETVYFGPDGFGSLKQITKDAQAKDDTITYEDVRDWKSKQSFGQKAKPRGSNSFIASEPYQEYQCDLFFWPKPRSSELQRTRATWRGEQRIWSKTTNALLIVDIFTKFTQVVPLKSKSIPDVIQGMKECLKLMRRTPKSMYMDSEGAFVSKEMKEYFESMNIEYFFTLGHAPVAERQIRTVKELLYRRIEHTGADWVTIFFEVLQTYNYKMVHTVSKFTPVEAMKPGNLAQVKFNLELRAKKQRTYPDLAVGDYVKIFHKKDKLDKERHSNWMPNKEKIKEITESMGQTFYVIDNIRRPNPLVRRDLLKVDPPTAVEAQRRAEEDERTHGGRPPLAPSGGGSSGTARRRHDEAKAKAKAKAKARPRGSRLGD
jgi:hypothetical protein